MLGSTCSASGSKASTLSSRSFDGDAAVAVSDWFLVGPADEAGWNIRMKGRYEDRFRRTPDGWRIVERRMTRAERLPG
jgi:ketosteroid isomerase-like protein